MLASAAARSSRPAPGPGGRLLELYALPADGCTSPSPASTPPSSRPGRATGGALLCVAAVTPARATTCCSTRSRRSAGLSLALHVRRQPRPRPGVRRGPAPPRRSTAGWATGCHFPGRGPAPSSTAATPPRTCWCWPSRAETYGMVVTEALARGLPVVAADVGGVPEALGHGADGIRPGLLVPPDDPAALGDALRAWLGDAELRQRLRRAARERRASLAALVDHHVRRRRRPRGGGAMIVEAIRRQRGMARPARAAPTPRPGRASSSSSSAPPPGRRSLGDPRPRLRHRGDGPLARAAAARAAALGPARPRRRTCWSSPRPTCPARPADGAAVTVETRRSDITPAAARTISPARRSITASALLDLLTATSWPGWSRVCAGAGLPGAADALRRRPRRADAGGSAGRAAWPPRSTPTSAARRARGRLLGPDAVDGRRARRSRRLGAEVVVRPSPWRLGAAEAALAAEWLTGWVGAACEQEAGLAADAERLRAPASERGGSRPARGHRRPRRPAGAADETAARRAGARLAAAPAMLAVLVWRLGTGPFLDGVRTVDGRALLAAAAIGAADHGVLRLALEARRRAASASTCRCPPRSRPTTARCSSTSRCPAASSATSTAASATAATSATSAAACGPSPGSAPPGRSCRPC